MMEAVTAVECKRPTEEQFQTVDSDTAVTFNSPLATPFNAE